MKDVAITGRPRIKNHVKIKTPTKRGNPTWQKGRSANPNGRPKGSTNRFSMTQYKQAVKGGQLPLQFMLEIMRDSEKPDELRLSAAAHAAIYIHRRQPIGIEQLPDRFGALSADQVRRLPAPALQQLLAASQAFYTQLQRLGITQPQGQIIDVETPTS